MQHNTYKTKNKNPKMIKNETDCIDIVLKKDIINL